MTLYRKTCLLCQLVRPKEEPNSQCVMDVPPTSSPDMSLKDEPGPGTSEEVSMGVCLCVETWTREWGGGLQLNKAATAGTTG